VGQLDDLLLAKKDEQKRSGTGSGGRSWADFHDHHSHSTRRTPFLVASKFLSDRGNMALASLRTQLAASFGLLIGKHSDSLSDSIWIVRLNVN
jgi:hypothetical protein